MKLQGHDFCFEDHFNNRVYPPEGLELLAPEQLEQLQGKHITSIRLKLIRDLMRGPVGTIVYLEIETKD